MQLKHTITKVNACTLFKLCCDCGHELTYERKVAIFCYDEIRIAVIVKFFS